MGKKGISVLRWLSFLFGEVENDYNVECRFHVAITLKLLVVVQTGQRCLVNVLHAWA